MSVTSIRPPARLSGFLGFLLLLLACTLHGVSQTADAQLSVTYAQSTLSLGISYRGMHRGSGQLTAEVLDPEDHVLGHIERGVEVGDGDGTWRVNIVPEKAIAFADLPWQRIHYRFAYDGSDRPALDDTESISQVLRRPVVHILGQTDYIAGSHAAVRVVVSDDQGGQPQSGSLRIELLVPNAQPNQQPNQQPRLLFTGKFNRRGTVEAGFDLPAGLTGQYQMRYAAETPIGSAEFTQPVRLAEKASILLTTEKPIYQPGQTIHVRALALDRPGNRAEAGRDLTFEVEDARGNKVFRRSTATDKFGIASAEFALADEVNLGAWHLRALMGDPQSPSNTAELTLNVQRYVLPKFKVSVEFSGKDAQHGYRPGDHVTGTVRANYFFGKAVDHAEVTVKASAMDVEMFQAASVSGSSDADGAYRFDLKLPDYFAGKPLSQGTARVLIEATVKDSAAHAEMHGEPITVSQSPLLIMAVPEGGTLAPDVENDIFILSSYADGSPARTTLTVHPPAISDRIPLVGEQQPKDQRLETDDAGIAVFHMRPGYGLGSGTQSLRIEADDHHGNRTASTVPLQLRGGTDQILLHTTQAVFSAGDHIRIHVLSTRASGAAYVDVVRNGQTILTRDVDLENGQAELTLDATPAMAGTLDLDAYLFGRDAQPVADHRLIFVQPAGELKIAATTDAALYRPGADARIDFHVTNAHGEGVQAALGLQVVDEAVFALAEQQPGFAKVFFYLEQEAMKPRYEIHSLSMSDVVEPADVSPKGEDNLAARALFSATEMANPSRLDVVFGRDLPQDSFADYQQRYRDAFLDQVQRLASQLGRHVGESANEEEIIRAFNALSPGGPRDAWNTPLRIERTGWAQRGNRYFLVQSAGEDRRFSTEDDLSLYIEDRSGAVVSRPGQGGNFDLRIEHDRGPLNQLAEATGTVTDPTGAVVSGATITLRALSGGVLRTARANAAGQFTFAGLPAERYQIEIASPGFEGLSSSLTLQPRDRAIVSAVLSVGAVSETVTVTAAPPMLETEDAALGGAMEGEMFSAMPMAAADGTAINPNTAARRSSLVRSVNALSEGLSDDTGQPATAHVRSYFPEALYINPEIITDGKGDASISIPVADSITTWRMAMLASTESGELGTADASLKVFQDFFVDLDLPVTLTQGDRVSIPVAVYNYSGSAGQVSLKLQPDDWFALGDNADGRSDAAEKSVSVKSGEVGGSQFTLTARRIGKFKLTLSAHMDGAKDGVREDIVVREIDVVPNGREQDAVVNGTLDGSARHDLPFPTNAIPDASSIVVRLYPGPLSQVIEGMDSILSMPSGCFEQTSSSTYPNVLALDYMKRTKKLTPEVHAKAEGYIANGYQRLLTFEVPGGGFSWFGQAPANKILTAYGLMEFNDMSKVSDVDPRLIERTRDWLVRQQQPDGSWKPDTSFINEGATNRYNSDALRITAYIAWSLANTGYQGPAVEKAKAFVESSMSAKADAYTLAVIANFAVDYARDRDFTARAMQALLDARSEQGELVSWNADETGVYSTGQSAAIETTGLATQALLKWGQAAQTVRKALAFLSSKKQASGNWGTTQATIMALRALLLATQLSASDVHGSLAISLNGKPVQDLELNAGNNDLLHQFVFKDIDPRQPASVQLNFKGSGTLAYQIVGRAFVPWTQEAAAEPLSIQVSYDRTHLAQNDVANATATVRNNLTKTANMVMVDLGIPPGFDLLTEDLQDLQEKSANAAAGRLEKFSLTATQAILYFNSLAPRQTITLHYRLRAKYPLRAHTFQSRVYEYYDPDVRAVAQPVELEVAEREK